MVSHFKRHLGLLALAASALHPHGTAATKAPSLSFNEHIQPILAENCFQCHGPDAESRKGDLRLDRREYAVQPRKEGGVAIAPGDPENSLLIRRVTASDPQVVMPPPEAHKSLDAAQIALFRRWIAEGAVYQEHWAFLKPVREPLPAVKAANWIRTPFDRFVLAKLESAGLTGSPEADRHASLRRVTFDLTGLPPTPAEIADFLSDHTSGAYERVVDRLLATPRFGEHRARYWLDAVRYGDTNGEHADNLRTTWPFRDYVINAFNANKRYDEFVIEQLAGDLLPASNLDQLVATQFNRLHTTTNEGGSAVEEIYLHKLTDRTQTTAAVFLGLTMACAACHDHKFDPIAQDEFYQFAAFFNNMPDSVYDANQAVAFPTVAIPPPEKRAEANRLLAARAKAERALRARTERATELIAQWIASGGADRLRAVPAEALQARFRLDEANGKVVRNTAPGADPVEYSLAGDDQSWGGSTRPVKFWTGLRFGVQTSLKAESVGDFESTDAFTAGGWFLPRERSGTTTGSFVSRMSKADGNRGWDLFWQNAPTRRPASPKKKQGNAGARAVAAQAEEEDEENRPEPEGFLVANLIHQDKQSAITVRTKRRISRKEWVHLAFTYDGSGKAGGVRLFINGEPQEVDVLSDNLNGSIRTSAPWQLARRAGGDASPETGFQDIRVYARALSLEEVRRMTHEDLAAEIVRRPIETWNEDERKIVVDYFFQSIDDAAGALRQEIAQLEAQFARATAGGVTTLIARERESRPVGFVLNRGVYHAIDRRVEAGVPAILPPLPPGPSRNRLALARWLVQPDHPLTARVAVNRMWQELFGTGIVETPENFGTAGARPSNRALLDWLALDFLESGWDVKRFYRQVVLSATYRQSGRMTAEHLEKDPANRLFSRGPRYRLDAEMIRDQALAASGLLVEKIGGPSVRPYQAAGVWEAVAVQGQSNTRDYVPDKGDGLYRRSVYTFWKRAAPNPVLATFDAPKRDVCTLRRDRTNTPLQALVTENATDYLEAARHLAGRALALADTGVEQKLDCMALSLLSRPLTRAQQQILARSLERFRQDFSDVEAARAFLSVGDSPVDPGIPPTEFAAWTLVASQLINTDQALNK